MSSLPEAPSHNRNHNTSVYEQIFERLYGYSTQTATSNIFRDIDMFVNQSNNLSYIVSHSLYNGPSP